LRFSLDHAWAQEAVRSGLDLGILEPTLAEMVALSVVRSAAGDRAEYHRRSDLERRLAGGTVLEPRAQGGVVIVVADWLSVTLVNLNVVPVMEALVPMLAAQALPLNRMVLATQARVALGDALAAQIAGLLADIARVWTSGVGPVDALAALPAKDVERSEQIWRVTSRCLPRHRRVGADREPHAGIWGEAFWQSKAEPCEEAGQDRMRFGCGHGRTNADGGASAERTIGEKVAFGGLFWCETVRVEAMGVIPKQSVSVERVGREYHCCPLADPMRADLVSFERCSGQKIGRRVEAEGFVHDPADIGKVRHVLIRGGAAGENCVGLGLGAGLSVLVEGQEIERPGQGERRGFVPGKKGSRENCFAPRAGRARDRWRLRQS